MAVRFFQRFVGYNFNPEAEPVSMELTFAIRKMRGIES